MKSFPKIFLVLLFFGLLLFKPTPSYAWHGHGHDGWHGRTYVGFNFGWPGPYYGYPYYPYYADPYYYPQYAVVSSATYQPVIVNGVTYYTNNGVYYLYTQNGYQAVATPAGVTAPVAQIGAVTSMPVVTETPVSSDVGDSITINIPNTKGGYTAVVIKRSGKGFTGPQGEFYNDFPKVSQLQLLYGK